jgi:hypothetical protein
MMKKFYESAKWLFNITVTTVAWLFIFNVIDDYQHVDWGFFEIIEDGDWDGVLYCVCGTACIAETFRNISKSIVKFVKEIKG